MNSLYYTRLLKRVRHPKDLKSSIIENFKTKLKSVVQIYVQVMYPYNVLLPLNRRSHGFCVYHNMGHPLKSLSGRWWEGKTSGVTDNKNRHTGTHR